MGKFTFQTGPADMFPLPQSEEVNRACMGRERLYRAFISDPFLKQINEQKRHLYEVCQTGYIVTENDITPLIDPKFQDMVDHFDLLRDDHIKINYPNFIKR